MPAEYCYLKTISCAALAGKNNQPGTGGTGIAAVF
jgi:hypothetical protein